MDCCCSCWRPCLYNKPNNKTGDSNWSRVPCMLSWVMIQERVLINPIKVDSSVYSLVARYNIFSYLVLVVEWIGKISYLFNVLHSSGWTNTGIVEWSSMPLGNIAGHDWGRTVGRRGVHFGQSFYVSLHSATWRYIWFLFGLLPRSRGFLGSRSLDSPGDR